MTNCPSILALGQFITDDLGAERMRELAIHLNDCNDCKFETERIRRNASVYQKHESIHLNRFWEKIAVENRRSFRRKGLFGAGLVAAVVLAVLVVPKYRSNESDVLYKGAMTIEVVAMRGEHQFRVVEGSRLREGDAVRFVVFSESEGFLYVFSLDSTGEISPFYPDSLADDDPAPMILDETGYHELPESIILDGAVGNEYFVVVFSENEFSRVDIEDRVLDEWPPETTDLSIDLGPEFKIRWLRIFKVPGGDR